MSSPATVVDYLLLVSFLAFFYSLPDCNMCLYRLLVARWSATNQYWAGPVRRTILRATPDLFPIASYCPAHCLHPLPPNVNGLSGRTKHNGRRRWRKYSLIDLPRRRPAPFQHMVLLLFLSRSQDWSKPKEIFAESWVAYYKHRNRTWEPILIDNIKAYNQDDRSTGSPYQFHETM